MKNIHIKIFSGICALLLLSSCEKEDKRTVFPNSTPVIENAQIDQKSFVFGDSITITAKVSDPKTPLSTLNIKIMANETLISETTVRAKDNGSEVSAKVKTELTKNLPDNTDVKVILSLMNVEGDVTQETITGIKGKRTYYSKLYLVSDTEEVYELVADASKSDKYVSPQLDIKSGKIRYQIAEKITSSNQVDFTGRVWGLKDDAIQVVDESGDQIITSDESLETITKIVFDNYAFVTSIEGEALDSDNVVLSPDKFADITIGGEKFKKISVNLTKGGKLTLNGDLASMDVLYSLDYFDRAYGKIATFLGEDGSYDLYYSESRKTVVIDPAVREYPEVLLASGWGLGYPSKTKVEATTTWGFDAPLQCIIFRKIATDEYQATVYFDSKIADFKFYENRNKENEKKSTEYTLPNIFAKDTELGKTDGNWYAKPGSASGNYKVTINLATKVVTAEPITLQ